jgi:hypothetical protein
LRLSALSFFTFPVSPSVLFPSLICTSHWMLTKGYCRCQAIEPDPGSQSNQSEERFENPVHVRVNSWTVEQCRWRHGKDLLGRGLFRLFRY